MKHVASMTSGVTKMLPLLDQQVYSLFSTVNNEVIDEIFCVLNILQGFRGSIEKVE